MFEWLLKVGFMIDALRLFPRVFITVYGIGLGMTLAWFWRLGDATVTQTSFVSLYTALLVPLLKWYMDNGIDWNTRLPMWFVHAGNTTTDDTGMPDVESFSSAAEMKIWARKLGCATTLDGKSFTGGSLPAADFVTQPDTTVRRV